MYLTNHTTERLTIRPLETTDIQEWTAFFENNDGLKFFALDDSLTNLQKAKTWIDWQLSRYQNNRFGLLALVNKETNELVGMCGLLTQEINGASEIEIGYHVLPQYWGKGFATEAAQFFKHYGWTNNISDSLISIIHTDNIRSQKVAEKNGMTRTIKTDFKDQPVYIYRISKLEINYLPI